MPVTREDVQKIADLANLYFSEEEMDAFVQQFQRILDYIEKLKEIPLDDIEPTSHVSLSKDFEKHMFREDKVGHSLSVEESLANAPECGSDQFVVPKVI